MPDGGNYWSISDLRFLLNKVIGLSVDVNLAFRARPDWAVSSEEDSLEKIGRSKGGFTWMWPGLALQFWALTFNPLNFNNNLEHLHLLLQRPVTFVITIILIVWRRLGGGFSPVWWMPTTRFPAAAAARADTPTVISLTLRCLQWTAELTPPPAHHQPNQLWLGRRWSWAISREANGQSRPVTWPTWVRPALCPGELQVNKWCNL